ncbi:MAG: hypothetical protein MI923_01190 [Phycisphaerales bacterium]|nr:hypothetical protein [Phycisphaerales bacterium]
MVGAIVGGGQNPAGEVIPRLRERTDAVVLAEIASGGVVFTLPVDGPDRAVIVVVDHLGAGHLFVAGEGLAHHLPALGVVDVFHHRRPGRMDLRRFELVVVVVQRGGERSIAVRDIVSTDLLH